jgi:predicted O-methyltransferase YrrM
MKISNETRINHKVKYTSDTSGTREHFLSDIVKNNNLRMGAEIGVRTGKTTFHILDNNPECEMYAIDKDITQFFNDTVKEKYGYRLKTYETDSRVSPDFVADNSLDFFFIDASHTYKNVKKDLQAWLPKLKQDGWMMGHDIDYPSVEAAVKDVIGFYEVGPDNVWLARNSKTYPGIQENK